MWSIVEIETKGFIVFYNRTFPTITHHYLNERTFLNNKFEEIITISINRYVMKVLCEKVPHYFW